MTVRRPGRRASSCGQLATIRTEFGRFGRQVSGYSLEHLLPENGFDVARFLAGTEGTLGVITGRPYGWSPTRRTRSWSRWAIRRWPTPATPPPDRASTARRRSRVWTGGSSRWCAGPAATPPCRRCPAATAGCSSSWSARTPPSSARGPMRCWPTPGRSTGSWSTTRSRPWPCGRSARTAPGWPGSASPGPPTRAGRTPRCRRRTSAGTCGTSTRCSLMHGLDGLPYGHFGDGCVHIRIDFPLTPPGGAASYRSFVEQAAELVAGYGGSMSGEHGDGRARSALLPAMYSPAALDLFGSGQGRVRPREPAQSRRPGRPAAGGHRSAGHRAGRPGRPLRRCGPPLHRGRQVPGRQHQRARGDVPLVPGDPGGEGLDPRPRPGAPGDDQRRGDRRAGGPRVHQALDLCLSCKGCARDCPTGIDMAAYKSQVLDQTYRAGCGRAATTHSAGCRAGGG